MVVFFFVSLLMVLFLGAVVLEALSVHLVLEQFYVTQRVLVKNHFWVLRFQNQSCMLSNIFKNTGGLEPGIFVVWAISSGSTLVLFYKYIPVSY